MAWTFSVMDGFDHYAPANATWKYRVIAGAFTTVPGPFHGNGARFTGGGNYLDRGRGGVLASRGGMCHLRIGSTSWGATDHVCVIQLVTGSGGSVAIKQHLWVHANGRVSVVRLGLAAEPIEIATTAVGVFPFDAWVYLEYAASLSTGTGGGVWLRLDGTEALTATGVQTVTSGATAADLRWGNIDADGNAVVVDFDDLAYTSSQSGTETVPPVWGGPHAVRLLPLVGPGLVTEMTPVGAAANWQCCADAIADGDTTYVTKTSGTTPSDLYAFAPAAPALPEGLPVDFDDPVFPQYSSHLLVLARHEAGSGGTARFRYHYTDEDGVLQDFTNNLQTPPVANTYWYSLGGLDPYQSVLETLQAGWSGDALAVFRGSQLAVELWYPAPEPAPPTGGGARWSVGWVP